MCSHLPEIETSPTVEGTQPGENETCRVPEQGRAKGADGLANESLPSERARGDREKKSAPAKGRRFSSLQACSVLVASALGPVVLRTEVRRLDGASRTCQNRQGNKCRHDRLHDHSPAYDGVLDLPSEPAWLVTLR